jgi:hypothetical protein
LAVGDYKAATLLLQCRRQQHSFGFQHASAAMAKTSVYIPSSRAAIEVKHECAQ